LAFATAQLADDVEQHEEHHEEHEEQDEHEKGENGENENESGDEDEDALFPLATLQAHPLASQPLPMHPDQPHHQCGDNFCYYCCCCCCCLWMGFLGSVA
jgi:hypothetical protein